MRKEKKYKFVVIVDKIRKNTAISSDFFAPINFIKKIWTKSGKNSLEKIHSLKNVKSNCKKKFYEILHVIHIINNGWKFIENIPRNQKKFTSFRYR